MRERSLSFKRALGVNQARARLSNAEGSAFGLHRTNSSVQSNNSIALSERLLYYFVISYGIGAFFALILFIFLKKPHG